MANLFFQIGLVWGNRASKDVDLNHFTAKKPVVEFFLQITKRMVLAGFTTCKALVKFCVAASSQMEKQSRNNAASARPSDTSVITSIDTTNLEARAVRAGGPADAAHSIQVATFSGLRAFAQICSTFLASVERAAVENEAALEEAESVKLRESGEFDMQVKT